MAETLLAAHASDQLSRTDAERVIAREHGFATWRQLETHIDHDAGTDDFLCLGCLSYFTTDRPANRKRAREILNADPALARRDIWHAACVGDATAVADFLDSNTALVNQRGGTFDWEPLLYACYSRLDLPGRSTLAVARLLIERGADPNTYHMWGGQYRFTALTGAFGEGEMGPVNQPPHAECDALARLLLDAGAHPNDSQALYNTMFTPGNSCLETLLGYGLHDTDRNNWLLNEDGALVEHPQQTLGYQLGWAVRNHHFERAKLLIDHGADLSTKSGDGRSLYESALLAGHPDLAQRLADRGAEPTEFDAVHRFVAACMAADAEAAARLLDEEPGLVARTQDAHPDLLDNAASANRLDAMRLMIALGFDLNRLYGRPPLHQAGFHNHVDMAKLLLAGGAKLGLRENEFAGTPLQWAVTAGSRDVADYLAEQELGIFDAVLAENLGRIATLLDASPALLETTVGSERPAAAAHPEDWQTPLAFAVTRKRPASVKLLLERGADAGIADRDGRQLVEIARVQSTPEIASLLRPSRASDSAR